MSHPRNSSYGKYGRIMAALAGLDRETIIAVAGVGRVIIVTGSPDVMRPEFGDRRFVAIDVESQPRLSGNRPELTIIDDVFCKPLELKKPPARKGPTKNRKWWEK